MLRSALTSAIGAQAGGAGAFRLLYAASIGIADHHRRLLALHAGDFISVGPPP